MVPFDARTVRGGSDAFGHAPSGVVDHRLVRRALLSEYRKGRLAQHQVCDAHPELLRAARALGEETRVECPICQKERVVLVTYVFGPKLPAHGRCVSQPGELGRLNRRSETLTAYVVEVCRGCGWNHLLRGFNLGGRRRAPSVGP